MDLCNNLMIALDQLGMWRIFQINVGTMGLYVNDIYCGDAK